MTELSTGSLSAVSVRVVKALASEPSQALSGYVLQGRSHAGELEHLNRVLYRLEQSGWVTLAKWNGTTYSNAKLTDPASRICQARGWDQARGA